VDPRRVAGTGRLAGKGDFISYGRLTGRWKLSKRYAGKG
jgi:hypothetical protein